jgi:hypothetical protein
MATDGFLNRFWEAPDAATRPTLMVQFNQPTRLVDIIVHNGGGDDFQALARPEKLHLVYFNSDGTVIGADDLTLEDRPDSQTIGLHEVDGAKRVAFQVMSAYPSTQGNPALALSEIEFYERR